MLFPNTASVGKNSLQASPGVDFKANLIVTKAFPLLPVIFYNNYYFLS